MSIYKRVAGNLIVQTVGATDSVTFQGLTANTATVIIDGNLTVTGNAALTGNISGDNIFNGTTSIAIPAPNGNANITIGGTSNVAVFASSGLYVTGLLSATGNITAANFGTSGTTTLGDVTVNGSEYINFTSNTGVDPVIRFTDANTAGASAGNIGAIQWYTNDSTGAGARVTAAIRAVYSDTNGNANILIQTGATSTPTTRIAVVGATGNVGFGGNVAPAHTVAVTGNIYASTQITAVGNISGGNLLTAGLISATGTTTAGNIATGGTVSATGNITGGNIISLAAVSAGSAGVSAVGNVTGGNINSNQLISATGNIYSGGNLLTQGYVSATGNLLGAELRVSNANVSGQMYGTGIGVENIVWQSTEANISSASMANVGTLTFSTLAGYSYKFEAYLPLVPAGSTTTAFAVGFPVGTCYYTVSSQTTATSAFAIASSSTSDTTGTTQSMTGTDLRTVKIEGTFYHNGTSTVTIRAQTSAANVAVKSGAYLTYTRIG